MQVMSPTLYGNFPGYAQPYDDVVLTTGGGGGGGGDMRAWLQSPQVLATVRRHFACPTMEGAPLEDGAGEPTLHWEARNFHVCTRRHTYGNSLM